MANAAVVNEASTESRSEKIKLYTQSAEQTKLAVEQHELFQVAKASHAPYVKRAVKMDKYYLGDQWEDKDRQKLDGQGRPALTINQCMPIINVVLGEQASRRANVKFKAAKDTTEDDAALMDRLYASIMDNNQYDWVESQVFADGAIQERGYFDVRAEFDDNLFGHVKITALDPLDVIIDQYAKDYDPDTWTEVFTSGWLSLDYIEATYGVDKRKMLEHLSAEGRTRGSDSFQYDKSADAQFGDDNSHMNWMIGGNSKSEKRRIRSVRYIERQFKQLHWVTYFIDGRTGDKAKVPKTWSEERVREVAAKTGVFVHKVREQRIRWRVTADQVLLHDSWSPYHSFTIVPFFPYFRRGKSAGVMTNLMSPQEMLNKVSSQVLHVVNTTANSGWVVEANSLANMSVRDLERRGAETGLVIEVKPGAEAPAKIQPNQIPTGLERVTQNAQSNMKMISGITDALLGLTGNELSGVALDSKERRGQIQLQVPMDNLAKTRHFVTRRVLELIQEFMTEERVMTVTNERPMPGQPATEEFAINQRGTAGEILNDVTRGKYSWVISSQPARDTFNDSQFAEALALRDKGVAIPDDRIVEYSNLEHKHGLAEELRQMSGRGELSPEQQELQRIGQEMALMREQLELSELESKVMKLRSEAQLNEAKTGEIDANINQRIEDLEAKVVMHREGLEVRKQLADKQSVNKLEGKLVDHKSKQVQQFTAARLSGPSQGPN